MRVSRFFVDLPLTAGAELELPDAVAHHLVRVLRAPAGTTLRVFNGTGEEFQAVLTAVSKRTAQIRCDVAVDPVPESPIDITLCQAISKGERMDYAIQKATELGVTRIRLLHTQRVDVRLGGDRLEKKMQHWQRVAVSAAEQCGRSTVPTVDTPLAWPIEPPAPGIGLILDPLATHGLSESMQAEQYSIAIGPEGGFNDEELAAAQSRGWHGVRLGPRVLRTETAGPAIIAALQSRWGDFSG